MLLENGTYDAVVRDNSLYLRGENERLTAAFRLECEGKELVHREWMELNDGTISDKTIKRLRACFPDWDGSIETLEQGFCCKDVQVEITVENEQDREDPEKWWTRVQYMDPPGGGGGSANLPEKENRATLVSKYGARFRALAGGVQHAAPATTAAPATPPPPSAPPPSPRPAPSTSSGQAPKETPVDPSTLEECWEALCEKHPDEMREQVSERWFELLGRIGDGKDQADFGPGDWGRVLADIKLPF